MGDVPTIDRPRWGRSVGLAERRAHTFAQPLPLASGATLPAPWTIAYEIYGTLNEDRSNAILLCHALSGDAHAAGRHSAQDPKPGWAEAFIGPGRAFDTDRYAVICSNIIGGCGGSTGPASINPATGRPFGSQFPVLTIGDLVTAQSRLLDVLGIERLLAVAGGSLGGMQALDWVARFPERVRGVVAMATTARSSAQTLALNAAGRLAITGDPDWRDGDYYDGKPPAAGLATARRIGHISYLSPAALEAKFDRDWIEQSGPRWSHAPEFAIESYLDYQGRSFVNRFDANSYLVITRAMDYFDLNDRAGGLVAAFRATRARFWVASWSTDWLYPPSESERIVQAAREAGRDCAYLPFASDRGHDAFLLEDEQITPALQAWLWELAREHGVLERRVPAPDPALLRV
ncbi:MAG TPA: homoserine O-acetyltransferase [Herpetosiphonaceae bacterium]